MNKELLDEKLKNREQLIFQQNEKISALEKEIQRLKVAAETEFQKAEGKAEMKRWFQERLHGLEEENAAFREGLEKIRDKDYRGNRSTESHIAFHVLTKYPKKENRSVMGEQK